MNCVPEPVPTFWLPGRVLSIAGQVPEEPEEGVVATLVAGFDTAASDEDVVAVLVEPEQEKSQVRPASSVTIWALQRAGPLAWATQQPDAQSAALKHWPVMNWAPEPVPTLWLPARLVSTVH
jgi:hypothetical protein